MSVREYGEEEGRRLVRRKERRRVKRPGSRSMKDGGSDKTELGPARVRVWREVWKITPPTFRATIWEFRYFDLMVRDWDFSVERGAID